MIRAITYQLTLWILAFDFSIAQVAPIGEVIKVKFRPEHTSTLDQIVVRASEDGPTRTGIPEIDNLNE